MNRMPLSMQTGNTGSRRGVVKSNSVQSQFAELSRDRDNLRNQADAATRERKMQEHSIKALREQQTKLMEEIRSAHTTLGVETKKRVLLQAEQQSKTKVLKQDRDEIAKLNNDLVEMVQKEENAKIEYSKEMTTLNEELEDALKREEDNSLCKLISVPTTKLLLETLRAVESQISMTSEEREVLCSSIMESLDLLMEAMEKMDNEVQAKEGLEEESRLLRYQAMNGEGTTEEGRKPLGEMELNELERLWEQSWFQEDSTMEQDGDHGTEPVNMNLFYGDKMITEDNQDENVMLVDDIDKENVTEQK